MEARVTRLEDDMKEIRDLLTEIRIELARKPGTARSGEWLRQCLAWVWRFPALLS
jgi:hypothetical protein